MNDLISREAAIDAMEKWLFDPNDNRIITEVLSALPSAQPRTKCIAEIKISKEDLDKLVTEKVEEIKALQPEIIHCRECKYGDFCFQVGDEDGNGFCSDAERREDERVRENQAQTL